jgi:type IV pilus assembly protein PilV
MNSHPPGTQRVEAGFTLVEVLVALVILAVGMLGIASLLLNSLQGSRTALVRTQAVSLAADVVERIRANRSAGTVYDTTVTATPALVATCETAGQTCTPADMARNDLKRWQTAIAATLPDGTGTISVQPITAILFQYTVTVQWTQAGDSTPMTYSLTVDI